MSSEPFHRNLPSLRRPRSGGEPRTSAMSPARATEARSPRFTLGRPQGDSREPQRARFKDGREAREVRNDVPAERPGDQRLRHGHDPREVHLLVAVRRVPSGVAVTAYEARSRGPDVVRNATCFPGSKATYSFSPVIRRPMSVRVNVCLVPTPGGPSVSRGPPRSPTAIAPRSSGRRRTRRPRRSVDGRWCSSRP